MKRDFTPMLERIKDGQWALGDIDWDAPGAELVIGDEEFYPKLKAFMADLMWIEHIGARGFAGMAAQARDDTLKQIYTYFHAEEQRHANAEMALMRRWNMIGEDEIPEPNNNIRLAVEWLDRYADELPLAVLGTVIPMLEVALDGCLCKFLLEKVEDPLCHEVFAKINADEARHLTVDFQVMDELSMGRTRKAVVQTGGRLLNPRTIIGIAVYLPLLNKMRDNIVGMGLDEARLYKAMDRYAYMGGKGAAKNNPMFKIVSAHGKVMTDRTVGAYHTPVDAMVKLTDRYPKSWFKPLPSWFEDLTWRPKL